jgi:tetratricopeptide (TPR) repeat protein
VSFRWSAPLILLLTGLVIVRGQNPPAAKQTDTGDIELVERLLVARRDYQKTLILLRAHYIKVGDMERAKWAEEELLQFHRINHQAFKLDMDVPPASLRPSVNIPEANKLYTQAMSYKDHGWGTDYNDTQRRTEILLQQILTLYPQSTKISDVAYELGDVYESKAFRQYGRAALYFERCFQWNPTTHFDARLRAARIYDRHTQERVKAIEMYREVKNHETDPKRLAEADKRLTDLVGQR